jgi:hypothetical protein
MRSGRSRPGGRGRTQFSNWSLNYGTANLLIPASTLGVTGDFIYLFDKDFTDLDGTTPLPPHHRHRRCLDVFHATASGVLKRLNQRFEE